MKKYFLLSLALIISALSFAQQIQFTTCEKPIRIKAENVDVGFTQKDEFYYSLFTNNNKAEANIYSIDSCTVNTNVEKTRYRAISHCWDVPDSLISYLVWSGEFNGQIADLVYRYSQGKLVWEFTPDASSPGIFKEVARFNASLVVSHFVAGNTEIFVSADNTKLAFFHKQSQDSIFSCLIDTNLQSYQYRIATLEEPIFLFINAIKPSVSNVKWKVLSNDGLIYVTESLIENNQLIRPRVSCIDIKNKSKKDVTPQVIPEAIGWICYFHYNAITYAMTPLLNDIHEDNPVGFVFWNIDDKNVGFSEPILRRLPDSLAHKSFSTIDPFDWYQNLMFFDQKEQGFIILSTNANDFLKAWHSSQLNYFADIFKFTADLRNTNIEHIEIKSQVHFKDKHKTSINNLGHLIGHVHFSQVGNSIILLYNSISDQTNTINNKFSSGNLPRCSIINADGKITTYELTNGNKPAGELVAANVVKQPAENTYKVYVVTQTSPHHYLSGYFILSP